MNETKLKKILNQRFGIPDPVINELKQEALHSGLKLEEVALRRGLIPNKAALYESYANELNIPYIDLDHYTPDPQAIAALPAELARKFKVVPLLQLNSNLIVATATPEDISLLDELNRRLHLEINPALSSPEAIEAAIDRYYPQETPRAEIDTALIDLEAEEALNVCRPDQETVSLEELANQAPVVRFVNTLLEQSLVERASDIHIEPEEDALIIRVRIDGLLQERGRFSLNLHPLVTSRIKLLAGMDISEKRKPQDGQMEFRNNSRRVDIRVSSFPTIYGENLVLRLLDKSSGPLKLTDIGMDETLIPQFQRLIHQPHGIILVTGPTGSGKSTTLYAVLNELNTPEKNIITLEDPVEYRLPGIRQCQINVRAGVTFASGLRAILRQNPDIIMVGEIRDFETAEIAFQAALTGHLVLATLHTNDAPSGLTRMIDMKVEPFLIASSVIAILAQRLVRKVCDRCAESYNPEPELLKRLNIAPETTFRRGKGCPACGNRGYRGRLGIFELLPVQPEIRALIMRNRSSEEIAAVAIRNGMKTLRQDGIAKALAGLTTPEEVLRVTQDI
ncbi:MAG: GspE/PulE family protein [candidate division WOR-3 bacterium]|jgi:type II secretion system protein E|nr:GspE/PulE family protein [candidate division WOR-3 bacterium]MCR4423539.1 GspE/PulE family protein [candidate division WOR-3 bacterium]MDH7518878.1 GspE/PulE family protein [bacterium]